MATVLTYMIYHLHMCRACSEIAPKGAASDRCHLSSTNFSHSFSKDTLAEWLRRRPAKPMGSPRVGSNPTDVDFHRVLTQVLNSMGSIPIGVDFFTEFSFKF